MRNLAMLFALVILASCAQVPRQASYPLSYQKTMQASEHWNELASRIAEKVKPAVPSGNFIFISDSDVSPFGNAMRLFLRTQLEKQGVRTTEDRNSPYELVWEVQRPFFNTDRFNYGHGIFVDLGDMLQAIFIGGVDWDFNKPHSEIIVSFDLLRNDKDLPVSIFTDRDTYVFYVYDADRDNYMDIAQKKALGNRFYSVAHEYTMTNN